MKINTAPYENIITEVLVDDREQDRIKYALKQYEPFNPQINHLDIGDYIFKNETIQVVFEYKTGNDFITSINNNHLHNQYYEMTTNYDYPFIIVECENLKDVIDERYYSTGLHMSLSQVNGAISDFTVNSTVLFAQTRYQAFDLMMRVAGKIMQNRPLSYKYGKKSRNGALNYLTAMRGVGGKAEIICKECGVNCLEDLLGLEIVDLTSVKGIGVKTAENILKQLKKDFN